MNHQVLTFRNSTFCPHSVFTCSAPMSLQRAIISLFSTDWLSKSRRSVYCAVRTESYIYRLYIYFYNSSSTTEQRTTWTHLCTQTTSLSSSTEVHLAVFQTDQTAPLGPVGRAPWDLGDPGSNLSPQARYPECSIVSVTPLIASFHILYNWLFASTLTTTTRQSKYCQGA
jgi:hypothetical protein